MGDTFSKNLNIEKSSHLLGTFSVFELLKMLSDIFESSSGSYSINGTKVTLSPFDIDLKGRAYLTSVKKFIANYNSEMLEFIAKMKVDPKKINDEERARINNVAKDYLEWEHANEVKAQRYGAVFSRIFGVDEILCSFEVLDPNMVRRTNEKNVPYEIPKNAIQIIERGENPAKELFDLVGDVERALQDTTKLKREYDDGNYEVRFGVLPKR